jgi:hypothetical protein
MQFARFYESADASKNGGRCQTFFFEKFYQIYGKRYPLIFIRLADKDP